MLKWLLSGLLVAMLFSNTASASNCSPYSYTLANGSTADANAVMGNFNNVLSCANNLAPVANPSFTGSLAISTTSPIYFNGSSDPNWEIGRNIVTATGGILTTAIQAKVYPASNQGFEIVNSSNYALLDVAGDTGNTYIKGYVGVGTNAPAFPVDISGGQTVTAGSLGCVAPPGYGQFNTAGGTNMPSCSYSFTVSLRTTNRIVAPEVDAVSDMRLKNLVSNLSPPAALDAINQLRPLLFTWKPEAKQRDTSLKAGFFAQEVAQHIPVAVSQAPGIFKDQYFLNYEAIIPYLVSAVQELDAKDRKLEAELQARAPPSRTSDNSLSDPAKKAVFSPDLDETNSLEHQVSDVMLSASARDSGNTRDGKLISVLFAAVTAQQAEISQLRATVSELKATK